MALSSVDGVFLSDWGGGHRHSSVGMLATNRQVVKMETCHICSMVKMCWAEASEWMDEWCVCLLAE